MSKKNGILLLYAMALISIAAPLHKKCATDNNSDIGIACNIPITGDLGTYGEVVRNGMLLAQAELKDKKPFFTMDIDFQNDSNKTNRASNIFNKQIVKHISGSEIRFNKAINTNYESCFTLLVSKRL